MTVDEIRKMHYTQKGKIQGIEEGMEKEKIEIAKNMLKEGLPIDMVSKLTGLSENEVKRLMN